MYRDPQSVPVEVDGVLPEVLVGKLVADIERMPILVGNQQIPLGELFSVTQNGDEARIEFEGDLSGVHWIGARMNGGQICVTGHAGRHAGSEMQGGQLHVEGDAGDWLGAEMKNGWIHVRGRAGHLVGAAYRGSRRGMSGGTIMVDGSVGNELGHTLRRGLIAVGGDVGDVAGFNMLAGTIVVLGNAGIRHGAGMKRGTLCFLGSEMPSLLPTFAYACRFRPVALDLILRRLNELKFSALEMTEVPTTELYHGDFLAGGRGEILLRAA